MALNNSDKKYTNNTYKISEVISNAIVRNVDIHADCEQDALDILADSGYRVMVEADRDYIDDSDYLDSCVLLGNSNTLCQLDTITIECIDKR